MSDSNVFQLDGLSVERSSVASRRNLGTPVSAGGLGGPVRGGQYKTIITLALA